MGFQCATKWIADGNIAIIMNIHVFTCLDVDGESRMVKW